MIISYIIDYKTFSVFLQHLNRVFLEKKTLTSLSYLFEIDYKKDQSNWSISYCLRSFRFCLNRDLQQT